MAHPFFDATQYPWHRPDAQNWWRALSNLIGEPRRISLFYKQSGSGLRPLNTSQDPDVIWADALERLSVAGYLRKLCDLLLGDAGYAAIHPVIRAVIEAKNDLPAGGESTTSPSGQDDSLAALVTAASRVLEPPPTNSGLGYYLLRFQPRGPLPEPAFGGLIEAVKSVGVHRIAPMPLSTQHTSIVLEIVIWADPKKMGDKRRRLRWLKDFFPPQVLNLKATPQRQ